MSYYISHHIISYHVMLYYIILYHTILYYTAPTSITFTPLPPTQPFSLPIHYTTPPNPFISYSSFPSSFPLPLSSTFPPYLLLLLFSYHISPLPCPLSSHHSFSLFPSSFPLPSPPLLISPPLLSLLSLPPSHLCVDVAFFTVHSIDTFLYTTLHHPIPSLPSSPSLPLTCVLM